MTRSYYYPVTASRLSTFPITVDHAFPYMNEAPGGAVGAKNAPVRKEPDERVGHITEETSSEHL